jgi:hypothetical protein
MLQEQNHSVNFSRSFSSLCTHRVHNFLNFKRPCIMSCAKSWEHPSAVATLSIVILLSARINSSPAAQLLLSQSQQYDLVGNHLRLSNVFKIISLPSCKPIYATDTSIVNRKHFFMNILCIESFCQKRNAQQNAALQRYTSEARSPFWLTKLASEHAHARLLLRPSWSWTVLLPSETHRKPITSITAVLLPFVTYLLTLPRM